MSLNGLDEPVVVEAHEAAIAEPGGWFLLKYEGRDEVQVLNRGTGGIVEMRNTIAGYDETSPLYGFLKYRRRNVIIKYLPEDCSRIIQARVAVHFNAVCERFSPYDITFEITTATELKDSKLSAACSLHTASCSTSSSTSSLRRRRLMEIAEEEEEEQRATKRQSLQESGGSRPQSPVARQSMTEPVTLDSELASSPANSKFSAPTTAEVPRFVGVDEPPILLETDLYTYGPYPYSKPKVKLGPRPSVDANGRPQTAGNFRPVSAIPAGFKLFRKGSKKGKGREREDSFSQPQDDLAGPDYAVADNPTIDNSSDRPVTSSGFSIDSISLPGLAPKKPIISRERARLMKAVQLREEKKKLNMQPSLEAATADGEEFSGAMGDTTPVRNESVSCLEPYFEKDRRVSLSKDDSGVILETVTPAARTDQSSDLTPVDSHPASPLVGSSDADHSTKASSISESTDETVHAKEEEQSPEIENSRAHGCVGGSLEGATHIARVLSAGEPFCDTEAAVEGGVRGTRGAAENLGEGTNRRATTMADVPQKFEDVSAHRVEKRYNGNTGLESTALPLSKFSANGARGLEGRRQALPDSSVRQPDPGNRLADRVVPPGKIDTSHTLNSKVSAQDLVAAAKAASQTTFVPPVTANPETRLSLPPETDHITEITTKEDDNGKAPSPREERQATPRLQVLPIQPKDLDTEEKLEEELQSGTFEEATSATVIETPVTPSFPSSPSKTQDGHAVRTVSNPVRGNLIPPSDVSQSSARSMSSGAAYLHHVTQQQQGGNLVRRSNIGSSISQRIQALQMLSASVGEVPTPPTRERPSSSFVAVNKREPSRSSSVMDRANSFRIQTPPSPERTLEPSPEAGRRNRLERSGSVTNRLSMFESPPGLRSLVVPSASNPRGRPESVSVTARIIRDPDQPAQMGFESFKDLSEYNPLDLIQSPLLVDHRAASPGRDCSAIEPEGEQTAETPELGKSSKSQQSSFSIVKGFMKERRRSTTSDTGNPACSPTRPDTTLANPAFSPRLSFSSHRSSLSKDRDIVLAPADIVSGDDTKSTNGDKKLSRTGRFMRRLSNLSGSRSKNNSSVISTSMTKGETQEPVQSRPSTTGTPNIVSYLGDVNVQFPDNLLWKRRNLSLDSQGFLTLSALPAQSGRPAQGTRRYHLSEFRAPYIPDVEVQELPNSVVLDFIERSSIQVACEDRVGQLRVLQTLQEAHATRGTTYAL
ncbi:hypothetical protein ED733_003387 [Metarhizium rileyi]|uniref:ADF-H domain-containing protein n=1 Tax=Metarhizium rileyi (strain RCEF 4871) TaxID=1649241 RepID=A0A5C6G368_METRR|nr:hypothetical protein ED733_003387 [Metarhizium rileyi]